MKKFTLWFTLLILPSWLYAYSLSELRTEIRKNVNDNPTSSTRYRYSDTTLNSYINQAQREIVNASWLCEKTTTYDLIGLTTYYNLPSDMIAIVKVDFLDNDGLVELKETSLKELFTEDPEWSTESGDPVKYYVSNTSSSLRIAYIPIPTTSSTGTVTVWYFNQAATLSSDSDVPFDGKLQLYPYHNSIVNHVSGKIKLMEQKINEAGTYFQMFGNDIKMIRDRINAMPNYNPSMVIDRGK